MTYITEYFVLDHNSDLMFFFLPVKITSVKWRNITTVDDVPEVERLLGNDVTYLLDVIIYFNDAFKDLKN